MSGLIAIVKIPPKKFFFNRLSDFFLIQFCVPILCSEYGYKNQRISMKYLVFHIDSYFLPKILLELYFI